MNKLDNTKILSEEGTKVRVKLVRSLNNCKGGQIKTAKALGLSKLGKEREHTVNACLKGQIKKIEHLLEVTKI